MNTKRSEKEWELMRRDEEGEVGTMRRWDRKERWKSEKEKGIIMYMNIRWNIYWKEREENEMIGKNKSVNGRKGEREKR